MRKSIPVTIVDETGQISHLETLLREINPESLSIPLGEFEVIGHCERIPEYDETRLYFINSRPNARQSKYDRDIALSEKLKRANPKSIVVPVIFKKENEDYEIAVREGKADQVVQIGPDEQESAKGHFSSETIESLSRAHLSNCINLLVSQRKFLYPPSIGLIGLGRLGKPLGQILAGKARAEKIFSEIGISSRRGKRFCESFKRATLVGRTFIKPFGSEEENTVENYDKTLDELLERKYDIIIYTHALHRDGYEEFESRNLEVFMKKITLDSMEIVLPELYKLRKTDALLAIMTNAPEPYVRFCVENLGMDPGRVTSLNIDILRANEVVFEHLTRLYNGKNIPFKIEDLNLLARGAHGGGVIDFSGMPYNLRYFVKALIDNPDEIKKLMKEYKDSGLEYVKDCHRIDMIPLEVPFMIAEECAKLAFYSSNPGVMLHCPWELDGEVAYLSGPGKFDFRDGIRASSVGNLEYMQPQELDVLRKELQFQKEMCKIFGQYMGSIGLAV